MSNVYQYLQVGIAVQVGIKQTTDLARLMRIRVYCNLPMSYTRKVRTCMYIELVMRAMK